MKILAALAAVVLALSCLDGCAQTTKAARASLDLSARALVAVDLAAAETLHLEDPAGHAATRDEYEATIRRWRNLEEALRRAHSVLLVAEVSVDAGETPSVGCVGAALAEVSRALEEAGVRVPEILLRAVNVIPKDCTP